MYVTVYCSTCGKSVAARWINKTWTLDPHSSSSNKPREKCDGGDGLSAVQAAIAEYKKDGTIL
jgi:hypothetical protein